MKVKDLLKLINNKSKFEGGKQNKGKHNFIIISSSNRRKSGRKVMRLIFYIPKFLFFFKHQCYLSLLKQFSCAATRRWRHCSHFWQQRWKSSTGMVFSMSVTLFWMFSKVPKMTSFEDIFKFRKKGDLPSVKKKKANQH